VPEITRNGRAGSWISGGHLLFARPEPLLLTVAQAAQRLGISRSLLYELLAAGDVRSITIGCLRRILVGALTTYIHDQRAKNPIPPT
jgi:excisionase family DNA binding protein